MAYYHEVQRTQSKYRSQKSKFRLIWAHGERRADERGAVIEGVWLCANEPRGVGERESPDAFQKEDVLIWRPTRERLRLARRR